MAKTAPKKTKTALKPASKSALKDDKKAEKKPKLNASQAKPAVGKAGVVEKPKSLSAKKSKTAKKSNDAELDDDLLSDEVEATEEIPDLADFDAEESEEPEAEDTDDADDDDDLDDEIEAASVSPEDEEIVLTDAEGRRLCRVRDCDQAAIVELYCRFHYLQNWKRIQVRRKILADGKLERYVEELTSRYPDKFLEMIRKDVRTEKDFLQSIAELEIDESGIDNDFEEESQNFIDEVRGVTSDSGMSDEEEF
jgi:hypothetical protein